MEGFLIIFILGAIVFGIAYINAALRRQLKGIMPSIMW
jgi:hypothetical protein